MAKLESIDYSKFERFSNVADEIFAKSLSSFLECEVLVVVTGRYNFIQIFKKAVERKLLAEDSTQIQEIEIIGNRKVLKSHQDYFGKSSNKINLVKYLFQR